MYAFHVFCWSRWGACAPPVGGRRYAAAGLLDYAVLDASGGCTAIELVVSGARISAETFSPPGAAGALFLLANYVFDTLPHDAFRVMGDALHEVTLSAGSRSRREPDPDDPGILLRLDNAWGVRPLPRGHGYYDDEGSDAGVLNGVLEWYRTHLGAQDDGASAAFLLPIGAFRCMRALRALSAGRLFVITGDKGFADAEAFRGAPEPHLAVHGSFSVMVNLHACELYAAAHGGSALLSPQAESSFSVSVFLPPDGDGGGGAFSEVAGAYAAAPLTPDDALVLHDALVDRGGALQLREVPAPAEICRTSA